jgi:Leucine-rich repeat (LRR) protein
MRLVDRLVRMSEDIADLVNLTLLDASHNFITNVPRELEDMTKLRVLRLGKRQGPHAHGTSRQQLA